MNREITAYGKQALFFDSFLTLNGNRELYLENCKRILQFSDVLLQLTSGSLRISIWGSDLRASDCNGGALRVFGTITKIEIDQKERADSDRKAGRI